VEHNVLFLDNEYAVYKNSNQNMTRHYLHVGKVTRSSSPIPLSRGLLKNGKPVTFHIPVLDSQIVWTSCLQYESTSLFWQVYHHRWTSLLWNCCLPTTTIAKGCLLNPLKYLTGCYRICSIRFAFSLECRIAILGYFERLLDQMSAIIASQNTINHVTHL
jgi:hypothetical protein